MTEAPDFPDPSNYSLGKLYTTTFYRQLAAHLAQDGVAAIQSSSPLMARRAFWCIVETVRMAGLDATPYHVAVLSFGEWGYVIASHKPFQIPDRFPDNLRFLNLLITPTLFTFPTDMQQVPVEVNHLNNQILVRYQKEDWGQFAP